MSTAPATTYRWWDGHTSDVLVCTADSDGVRVLSGEENGGALLWDGRLGTATARLGYFGTGEATAAVLSSPHLAHEVYITSGNKVLVCDLRKASEQSSTSSIAHTFDELQGEVNQVTLNAKGTYLAGADDDGVAMVWDLTRHTVVKRLQRIHTNICSTIQFRPDKPWELATGGLDSRLVVWDFSRGRPVCVLDAHDARGGEEESRVVEATQMFNPPFVHSLVFASKNTIIAALGSGDIACVDIPSKSFAYCYAGHDGPAAQVTLTCGGVKKGQDAVQLATHGRDNVIKVWDYSLNNPDRGLVLNTQYSRPGAEKINWVEMTTNAVFVASSAHQLAVVDRRQGE